MHNLILKYSYNGSGVHFSQIEECNKDETVNGVTFENVKINCKKITSAEGGDFNLRDFAKNVRFKKRCVTGYE